ncbi:MAG TPA: DUF5681 domain-containing protein [Candidatus Marinimicrobia bacterium]|mgnify:FL=1|nr:DUF5681 domain-containing protein [Candidatus Neomarinimicrobiota bacterium]HQH56668.1 DUF5681 domain-containing protein [Candidatus Neomarinimicrobiota bacterium]
MKKNNLNTPTGKQDEKSGRDSSGRWKPGQSGNPAGRPPKDATWAQIFDEELNLIFKNSGISTKREIARRLIALALNGNLRAISEILDRTTPPDQQGSEPIDLSEFAELIANNYSAEGEK